MAITKANLDALFNNLDTFESAKTSATGDIKEAIETFVEQYAEGGNNKVLLQAVKEAFKKHKKIKKDRAKFIIVEAETDQLTERLLED